MLTCFVNSTPSAVPIIPIVSATFTDWLAQQTQPVKNWLATIAFNAKPESWCLLADSAGRLTQVLLGINNADDFWTFGLLPAVLPAGSYSLPTTLSAAQATRAALAWSLGAYQFTRYKQANKTMAQLVLPEACDQQYLHSMAATIYGIRDLINTPTENMGPAELAQAAIELGSEFNAEVKQVIGDELLTNNYPLIHAVGRASNRPPRLIDLRWGKVDAPKITIAGKGVCFDSGGLDLKPWQQMSLMKKDMGGAAHALGLARLIMAAQLPVRLRVLIPAVENVIAGSAYKPGDVISSRKGLSVEIGNTDAEGRLVLADVLAEAASENPELLIDFATLTGAARVAVGTEISALFTNNDELAQQLNIHAAQEQDPIWRLPLHAGYRKLIDSPIADINNAGTSGYAGAITAALFLQEFVSPNIPWVHFDFMAWNIGARPGRPEGADAMAVRAVFSYLLQRFNSCLQ